MASVERLAADLEHVHEVGICQCGDSEFEHDEFGCHAVDIDETDFCRVIACNCRQYVEVDREVVNA